MMGKTRNAPACSVPDLAKHDIYRNPGPLLMRVLVVGLLLLALPLLPASGEILPTPDPPGYLRAEFHPGASPNFQSSIELTWEAPEYTGTSDLSGYNLYKTTKEGSELPISLGADTTTYSDTAVGKGESYVYFVRAVNTEGFEGAPSNPVYVNSDYPHCTWFSWSISPPGVDPEPSCLLPPPV